MKLKVNQNNFEANHNKAYLWKAKTRMKSGRHFYIIKIIIYTVANFVVFVRCK